MPERYTEFLVGPTGQAPRTLTECIRQVSNASAGFCRSWLSGQLADAEETSIDAFELLDHIQNEILRHRDVKSKLAGWVTSPFNAALSIQVGQLLEPAVAIAKSAFFAQAKGSGLIPPGTSPTPLTLAVALNKLKHRDPDTINFTTSPSGVHVLFVFTHGGIGRPDSISTFDVQVFCEACKSAAQVIFNAQPIIPPNLAHKDA